MTEFSSEISYPPDGGSPIPKNLFHIHIARDEQSIPAALRANLDELAARNPGWVQQIWYADEASDWVRATFPGRISDAYHRIAPQYGVCNADFLRYLLIWHFGGVYLDLKSNSVKPLDEMIRQNETYIVGIWRDQPRLRSLINLTEGLAYAQWMLVAEAGHPFLKAVIDRVVANIESYRPLAYARGARAIFDLTGPVAYTLAILPLRSRHPHREVDTQDEGWIYTVFVEHQTHRKMNPGHYGLQTALHVIPPRPSGLIWRVETAVFHLIAAVRRMIRPLNHWRLARRRSRTRKRL